MSDEPRFCAQCGSPLLEGRCVNHLCSCGALPAPRSSSTGTPAPDCARCHQPHAHHTTSLGYRLMCPDMQGEYRAPASTGTPARCSAAMPRTDPPRYYLCLNPLGHTGPHQCGPAMWTDKPVAPPSRDAIEPAPDDCTLCEGGRLIPHFRGYRLRLPLYDWHPCPRCEPAALPEDAPTPPAEWTDDDIPLMPDVLEAPEVRQYRAHAELGRSLLAALRECRVPGSLRLKSQGGAVFEIHYPEGSIFGDEETDETRALAAALHQVKP
jgi:hypothetical protein